MARHRRRSYSQYRGLVMVLTVLSARLAREADGRFAVTASVYRWVPRPHSRHSTYESRFSSIALGVRSMISTSHQNDQFLT